MYGSQTQSGHGFGQPNAGRGYQVIILDPLYLFSKKDAIEKDAVFPP